MGILWSGLFLTILGRIKIGNATTPEFASADNPTARHPSRLTRTLTFLYLPAASLRMFLCPSTLSFDWSMDTIPRIISLTDPRNLESFCLYVVLVTAGLWAVQQSRIEIYVRNRTMEKTGSFMRASSKCSVCDNRKIGGCHTEGCRVANNNNNSDSIDCCCSMKPSPAHAEPASRFGRTKSFTIVIISLGFLALPFIPASNLFFYVGFVIAERILYLPSVGACLSIGASVAETYRIVKHGSKTCGRLILGVTMVLLFFMAAKTLRRNMDWHDEESLYRSALHVNPPKGKFWNSV